MSRKSRIKLYEIVDFTNDLGHVIKPGDPILIVTKGYGNVGVRIGRYIGLRRKEPLLENQKERIQVCVEKDMIHKKLVHKVDGSPYSYGSNSKNLKYVSYPQRPFITYRTSPEERKRLEDEYSVAYEEYNRKNNEYYEACEEYRKENYIEIVVPYIRRSTLKHNRIYPIKTTI